jgi:hypothetical protein
MTRPVPDFGRRKFLKGAALGAGGTLLAPMLNDLALAADGVERKAPRFLFVVEGNGLPPEQLVPAGIEFRKREDREGVRVEPLEGATLPVSLAPVDAYRNRLSILQGLSGRMCTGGHSSDHGALGAFHSNGGRNVQSATIDATLGSAYPGIFPNVVLGISSQADDSVIFNCSADRPGRSLATICKPDVAFARMFGSAAEGEAKATFAAKRNLMDHMQGDIRRVSQELAGPERRKLESYLEAYANISSTTQRLVDARETLAGVAPVADDKYASAIETDRLDAHFEMAAAALIGGVTNVVTIASGVGFPYFNIVFKGLGLERGKHPIGHDYRANMGGEGWQDAEKIRNFHFQLIARFLDKLGSVPENDGTMLDNTTVVYLSDAAEEHHSKCFEWPMVVLGGRGLKHGGQYVSYPDYGRPGHRTINATYNTLLHAAGVRRDDFGNLDPEIDEAMHRGPLAELLA